MKILIVEDNQKFAYSLHKGLTQEGYAVDCVFDGESAERKLLNRSVDYDGVILDILLPLKNGLEVCKNLRANNVTLPVLMLTAKDMISDKILGLDSGADDYLIKPFDFGELLARMRALLRRPKQVLPVELSHHGIILNSNARTVTVGGIAVMLTLREFSVLELLMRQPNQIFTREQILAHAWEFAFDAYSNVVDVHIKNVRKKLQNYGSYLETIRGVGYRFKV